jgi:hypothetical protein
MSRSFQTLAFGALLLAVGCSSRPDRELVEAHSALETAKIAEADLYCPDLFQNAGDAFRAGESELATQDQLQTSRRDYKNASDLLRRARQQAETAAHASADRKNKAMNLATSRHCLAQMALEQARKRLALAHTGSAGKASEDELVSDLETARRLLADATKAYSEARFMDAAHQFEAATLHAQSLGRGPRARR